MNRKFWILLIFVSSLFFIYSETGNTTEIAGVTVQWSVESEKVNITITGETDGWIAFGIEPENKMKDASIYIGYVTEDGEIVLEDHYGNTQISHKSDIQLGGTSDVEIIDGYERNGITSISFKIPLNSGDEYDKSLIPGSQYKIIAAMGRRDDLTSRHTNRGTGQLEL